MTSCRFCKKPCSYASAQVRLPVVSLLSSFPPEAPAQTQSQAQTPSHQIELNVVQHAAATTPSSSSSLSTPLPTAAFSPAGWSPLHSRALDQAIFPCNCRFAVHRGCLDQYRARLCDVHVYESVAEMNAAEAAQNQDDASVNGFTHCLKCRAPYQVEEIHPYPRFSLRYYISVVLNTFFFIMVFATATVILAAITHAVDPWLTISHALFKEPSTGQSVFAYGLIGFIELLALLHGIATIALFRGWNPKLPCSAFRCVNRNPNNEKNSQQPTLLFIAMGLICAIQWIYVFVAHEYRVLRMKEEAKRLVVVDLGARVREPRTVASFAAALAHVQSRNKLESKQQPEGAPLIVVTV